MLDSGGLDDGVLFGRRKEVVEIVVRWNRWFLKGVEFFFF